jgi:endoribonuclease Nob1
MKAILDASFFFYDLPIEGELYTTPSVYDELKDIRSKGRFEKLCAMGLRIVSPDPEYRKKVIEAAKKTGDAPVISDTDCDLLALALEMAMILHTDDFAIQNVAGKLGIQVAPIQQRKARQIAWKYRCRGCGKYFDHDGECPICGAEIKRKLK